MGGGDLFYVSWNQHRGCLFARCSFPESEQYRHQTYTDPIWKKREFLASTDERFRPVNGAFGPDGCLYVVDFHRGVIQHKRFLTSICAVNLPSVNWISILGMDGFTVLYPMIISLWLSQQIWLMMGSRMSIYGACGRSKESWKVKRLDLVDSIRQLATKKEESPYARVHAMWALEGLGKLGPDIA